MGARKRTSRRVAALAFLAVGWAGGSVMTLVWLGRAHWWNYAAFGATVLLAVAAYALNADTRRRWP